MRRPALFCPTVDSLAQRLERPGKPSAVIRNACEYELFARAYKDDTHRERNARKVIGYHGALGEGFDSDLSPMLRKLFLNIRCAW